MAAIVQPDIVKEKHLIYLDNLRESGDTNMFGAGAWLQDEFGLERHEARVILKHWMETFGVRHPKE